MKQHLCIENLEFNMSQKSNFCPRLQHVSFSIKEGEHLVLYHPWGLGSSVILYLITGLIQPDSGHICIGCDSDTETFHQISLLTIQGLLFSWRAIYQDFPLCGNIPSHLVESPIPKSDEDNLVLIQKLLTTPTGYPSEKQQELWLSLLQRASIYSNFILLDRPFQHFDKHFAEICLNHLHENQHATMLIAASQLSEALLTGNRILFLGGDPVAIRYEYQLPFTAKEGPASRMVHPEYHKIYEELMEISQSV